MKDQGTSINVPPFPVIDHERVAWLSERLVGHKIESVAVSWYRVAVVLDDGGVLECAPDGWDDPTLDVTYYEPG